MFYMLHPFKLNPFPWKFIIFYSITLLVSCSESESGPAGWKKESDNPVLKKGESFGADFYALSDCWVLAHEGIYKMWYTEGGAVAPDTVLHSSIGYATSVDGIHWIKYADNPVMDISKTQWDSLGVETVTVIIDVDAPPSARYKMWYAGVTQTSFRYDIGYAFSPDGIHWEKYPDAVVQVGNANAWDNCFLEGPSVIKEGNIYKMWYAGYDCEVNGQATDGKVNIGYAVSNDGIVWVKHTNNPVMTVSTSGWDNVYVQDPHVLLYNGRYHMWFGGADTGDNYTQQTGYAYSDDGIQWTKSTHNPVVKRGKSGAWDGNTASFPSVLIDQGKLKMWYTGKDVDPLPEWPTPYFWEIGYASKKLPEGRELD